VPSSSLICSFRYCQTISQGKTRPIFQLRPEGLLRNRPDSRNQIKETRTRRFASISFTSREWIKRTASVLENGLSVSGASAILDPCAIHIVSERPPLRRAPPDQSTMM
jgi:hypothetical protein